MNIIAANTLKLKGAAILEEILRHEPEARISVRGEPSFVVMTKEHYKYLRDCELSAAIAESKADIAAGRFFTGTVEEHMQRLEKELA